MILDRLKEGSTWASLAAISAGLSQTLPQHAPIINAATFLFGMIGTVLKDRGRVTPSN